MAKKLIVDSRKLKKTIHSIPRYRSEFVIVHEGYRGETREVLLRTLETNAESVHRYNSPPETSEEIQKLLKVYDSREVYVQLNPDNEFYHGILMTHGKHSKIEDLFEPATVIDLWSIDLENITKLIVVKDGKRFYS